MHRRTKYTEQVTLEFIDAKFDRHLEQWRQDLKEMNAATEMRLAADRKEAAERLAADRKEAAERLAADRKEAEARQQTTESRLMNERKEAEARQQSSEARFAADRAADRNEFISQKRWLIANFLAVVIGMTGIFIALLVAIIAIVNGSLTV